MVEETPLSDYLSSKRCENVTEVLIDGEWQKYIVCNESRKPQLQLPGVVYLGKSKEIRIDGAKQKQRSKDHHFWEKTKP